ncbi:YoaK family protein [Sphingomonas sp. BIUV-7]|uniref:YoaK family protein n=1 Tax=Sphingomonas natans TaxID=3063330 RepID=A0ABT8Y8E0_9SPHN|nr:YoaK family protein [Sphingomonas sp. BIUV-7]MDO6414237.1 YoaK family protein [Sphingomonas sp. BIUV-7]
MATKPPPATPPLAWLLLMLSATTGLVDAASILGLGKVFTANMTGNIVFLGFAAAGAPGFTWQPYVVALLTFMAGALVAGRLAVSQNGKPLRGWLIRSALVETALLWIAAGVALGLELGSPDPARVFAIIALTAIAMGFRNATIRQLKVPDLTTTVLTLTITGIAADSALAGGTNPNWIRRFGAVAAIFAGATIGALLISRFGLTAPLALAGAAVLIGTLICVRHETPQSTTH